MPSSSLIPSDQSVLFTTAGMQQFKPYYLGEKSPFGTDVVSCQKCVRTSDIEEVGDERHLTFFEMLGNFSFGGYFKEEAIRMAHEFIAKELKLEIEYVTIFSPEKIEDGDWRKSVSEDEESYKIWEKIGISKDKIRKEGSDNFWGPTGEEGPCGPTTEIYVNGIEVWNLVFNEYFCDKEKTLKKLPKPGVDTGMGLERLTRSLQKKETIFETDLFDPIIKELDYLSGEISIKEKRIIADHIKTAVFLISEGILPSNIERGYVLRRILRRIIIYRKKFSLPDNFLIPLAQKVVEIYREAYPEIKSKETDILVVIQKEEEKFEEALASGLSEATAIISKGDVSGEDAFRLYQSYGFPLELIEEEAKKINRKVDRQSFYDHQKKHQEISRAGAEGKFGGVGKEANYQSAKFHTATHLLHAALRKALGESVKQMGSDINQERLRFDFSYPAKMTKEDIEKVEDMVNKIIDDDLEVKKEEMRYEEAIASGALAFFKEKYPEKVNVYSIGDFSKEICAGPHVKRTSELGTFKITKEESSSAGVRRIRATLS